MPRFPAHNSTKWWTLTQQTASADDPSQTYEWFRSTVMRVLEDRFAKKSIKPFPDAPPYRVLDTDFTLTEASFAKMTQVLDSFGDWFPLLTLHSSSKPDVLSSIAKHGYLLDGDVHPTEGWSFSMRHGNIHGDGIYSTPDLETTAWYGFQDGVNQMGCVVNLVIPGVLYDPTKNKKKRWVTYPDLPHYGAKAYADGSTTIVANDGKIWVSCHQDFCWPIAIIKLGPCSSLGSASQAAMARAPFAPIHTRFRPCVLGGKEKLLVFHHLFQDYYVVRHEDVEERHYLNEEWLTPALVREALDTLDLGDLGDDIDLAKVLKKGESRTLVGRVLLMDHLKDRIRPSALRKALKETYQARVTKMKDMGFEETKADLDGTDGIDGKPILRHYLVVPLAAAADPCFRKQLETFCSSLGTHHNNELYLILYDQRVDMFRVTKIGQVRSVMEDSLGSTRAFKEDFCGGLRKVLTHLTSVDHHNERVSTSIIYAFINNPVFGKGGAGPSIQQVIQDEHLYLKGVDLVVKPIFVKTPPTTEPYFHLKQLQNRYLPNEFSAKEDTVYEELFHFMDSMDDKDVFGKLLKENETLGRPAMVWRIPFPYGIMGEGFLVDLEDSPHWDARADLNQPLLYKGQPIDGIVYHHNDGDKKYEDDRFSGYVTRTVFRGHDDDLSVDAFTDGCYALFGLLTRLTATAVVSKDRAVRFQPRIQELCEGFIEGLEGLKLPLSLKKTFTMTLQGLVGDIEALTSVTFSGPLFDAFKRMKFAKSIAKRVKTEIEVGPLKELVGRREQVLVVEPMDVFGLSVGEAIVGNALRVVRTSAAEVEPWTLMVPYVSTCEMSGADCYTMTVEGKSTKDAHGRSVNGLLLVDSEGVHPSIRKMVHAMTFTGNPYLVIGHQSIALTSIAWVSTIEGLFRKALALRRTIGEAVKLLSVSATRQVMLEVKMGEARTELQEVATLSLTLMNHLIGTNPPQATMLNHMDAPEPYLTEAHDMLSMCKLFYLMLNDTTSNIFRDPRYSRLAFAILAEGVMRSCRTHLKAKERDEEGLLRKALGFSHKLAATDMETQALDLPVLAAKTNRFFSQCFSNASPMAIVGTLGVLEAYHATKHAKKPMTPDDLIDLFLGSLETKVERVTMASFLGRHLASSPKETVQLGLYLQGVRFHKAKHRLAAAFDPLAIIGQVRDELILLQRNREAVSVRAKTRKQARFQRKLAKAQPYKIYHTMPKVFSEEEVARLNLDRPADDQVVRQPSGLLVHHCCYPSCPDFLVNQESEADKVYNDRYGKTTNFCVRRHGLMHHLQYDPYNGNYTPSFHMMAKHFARSHKIKTFDAFCEAMDRHFSRSESYLASPREKMLDDLKSAWDAYTCI